MKLQFIYIFLAALFLLVSMFSYEGLLLAPLVIWFISVTSGKQKFWSYSWVLICIPIYLYARQSSGAFTGGGDYAYNLQTLPANILANLSGYFISVFGGPKVIEYFQQLRSNFRMYKMLMFVPISIVFSFIIIFLIKIRKSFQLYVGPMGWFMASILSLAPFLGLGGLAERYALVASGFIIIGGSILLHHFVDSKVSRISKFLVVGIVVYVTIWNIFETRRISGDWSVAHNVSKQTLLTMKKEFYPIRNRTVFVFVDTPIRYGRAWIFPTGLTDAFWHLFRGTPYAVLAEPTLPEAFDHNVKGSLYVLTFENYVLKRVQKQIETVNY